MNSQFKFNSLHFENINLKFVEFLSLQLDIVLGLTPRKLANCKSLLKL